MKNIPTKYLLIALIVLSALLRLFRLDYPNKFIFDEVYHAFTANEYLKGSKEAWEWWTTPPPGVAYEWTHPPLAKEIMTASMFLTRSTDAWAWRLPGALLGVLSVYLVYLLGLRLLNNQTVSLIAAFAHSIDGLNFVQSRVGMNDIYFVTFMLASLLLLLNKKFVFAAIFLGLSLSSKWAAVYVFAMYLIIFIYDYFSLQKGKVLRAQNIISYIVARAGPYILIPPLVYLLTYIPFFSLGHTPEQFIHLQQQMWWYHTNLKATHDYASPWWSWPLNLYPVWYFVDYHKNSIANIFASGNPAVFWVGAAAIILTAIETVKKKSLNLFIILLGFFVFWLPWAISPRIMFLYHFGPSIPFLSLAIGYQLELLYKEKRQKMVIILLILMGLSFILIYPFLVGLSIPKSFVNLFFLTNMSKNPF